MLTLTSQTQASEKKIELLDIQQPRTFGYQIGDQFERVIHLGLNLPYVLDEQKLPKMGRITEWLSLEKPSVEFHIENKLPSYKITLRYQIINIKPGLVDIPVPSHMLVYKHSETDEAFNAQVPATRVRVSALTDPAGKGLQSDIKPNHKPQSTSTIFVYLPLLIVSLLCLLYLRYGLPVLNRNHPFTQLFQSSKAQHRKDWSNEALELTLQKVHQAFNQTANKTVFTEGLDQFFLTHKKFQPLEHEITEFYKASRHFFFEQADHQQFNYSPAELNELIKKCSELERGIA